MPTGVTLGFIGAGKIEKKNGFALLRDFIDAQGGGARFLIPFTQAHWASGLEVVCDFAIENNIPFEAVTDTTTAKLREAKEKLAVARKQHKSETVPHKLVGLLEVSRKPYLLVLWDDEDEDALDALVAAETKSIPMYDLARGMDPIQLTDAVADEVVTDELPEEVPAEEPEATPEPPVDELPEEEELPEFSDEDEEELTFPDDEELPVLVADETTMTEFESRLLDVLERLANSMEGGVTPRKAAPKPVEKAAEKSAPAVDKAEKKAPAKAKRPAKATAPAPVPAKATKVPAKAKKATAGTNGEMTKAEAQRIVDNYVARRGRPPANVTKARQILGLV